jgi:acetyltransferase-like isoleucine patch superfamily enzyme
MIGAHGVVNNDCEIAGVDIVIGRELWMLPQAKIGGGSAFEVHSCLQAGNWWHIGVRSFLNTARRITVGDEVGMGTGTCLYTHGAYPSALEGKPAAFGPISVGDRTWIPGAILNPGVNVGKDCVIGVGSLVTRDIPDGSLAAGVPAKVIKENAYPKPLSSEQRYSFFVDFLKTFGEICSDRAKTTWHQSDTECRFTANESLVGYVPNLQPSSVNWAGYEEAIVICDNIAGEWSLPANATVVDCGGRRLLGRSSRLSERLLNQLRRYGIRFNYESRNGTYQAWE